MENLVFSLNDKPLKISSEDQLEVNKYINALTTFIINSDTPITIGLQGEWGTGKTSMMSLLKEKLIIQNVATSWVNTWEYSLFREVKETTPAILNGLLNDLKISCGFNWTLKEEAENKLKKITRFFGHIGNQILKDKLGVDTKEAIDATYINSITSRAEIAEIKNDIRDVINLLINDPKNPYQRVVFFVDDLDRINPSDAVQVLESLKNIFDFDNCIFVLAIDYDVVVKGLENKFGKKTEENEREFRSFFDKIIQVPFSMPIGTYDIDNFLQNKLKSFGLNISEAEIKYYLDVVNYSIGSNPRSLKRYLNTFSLLNTIRREEDINKNADVDFMLFSLLGIQISYPKLFRLISSDPNFMEWNQQFATRNSLDWNEIIVKLEQYGENDLIDEDWEKVVWGICQSDAYMKSRAFSVLELLNLLKNKFENNVTDVLHKALAFASITSIDDNQETKQNVIQIGNSRIRFSGLSSKKEQLLNQGCNRDALKIWELIFTNIENKLTEIGEKINYAKTVTSFYRWIDDKKQKSIQTLYFNDPNTKTGINFRLYGYNKNFIHDMAEIFMSFGWEVNTEELKIKNKSEIAPGLTLINPNPDWEIGKFGEVSIDKQLMQNLSFQEVEHIITVLINHMIKTLQN